MLSLFTVGLISTALSPAVAQQWLNRLPQDARAQPTVNDLRQAFNDFYKEQPPTERLNRPAAEFRFEKERGDEAETPAEEAANLFHRWEWLVDPRSYPSGKLDLQRIAELRSEVGQADERLTVSQTAESPLVQKFFLPHWTPLGPSDAVGGTNLGRVNCIEFDPKNAKIVYLCSADGGIWKSVNGGGAWTPLFDHEPTLSTGDVAIDPNASNILYVATSDSFGYGIPFWGGTYSVGVVKSTNGGLTWAPTGLNWTVGQNRTIRRLVVHPKNGKILLAATSDGVFRTDNGGTTWTQILPDSAYDVEFQQDNGSIAYATTTQVLKSTNEGATFTPLSASCSGFRYNIKIAKSNPKVLYTLCSNGAVQKSLDAGATWTVTPASGVTLYGYYDTVLAVSPVSPDNVYVAGFNIKESTNGGGSWTSVPVAGHVDNHVMKFAPNSNTTIYSGNDGGIFRSTNSGSTWASLNKGLSITQFYRIGVSRTNPNTILAGAQDNGNMKYSGGALANVTDADGMQDFIDWSNANVLYAGIQYGSFYRSTNGGASFTGVSTPSSGAWLSPWCQDPTVAATLYAGTDKVYKSVNQGTTWTPISGALSGVGAFTVLKVAPSNANVIYAGSGGKLYRTDNGGGAWTDVTAGLPVAANFLTDVAVSDVDPKLAYATFSGYTAGQKVFKTADGGATWSNISGWLPNMPVDTIVYQHGPYNMVYIGTDAGVYFINDFMPNWAPYKLDLPNVIVDDLQIDYKVKKIRAATYGRGIWEAPLL
jgi:photosystem II stability/assembly factor-like uncharacterized protein